jgi:glycine/D-amino acid oxidase-like deaminating enzyme
MRFQTQTTHDSRSRHARSTPPASDEDGCTCVPYSDDAQNAGSDVVRNDHPLPSHPPVPWWDDLTPATIAELSLPAFVEQPVTATDVVVIGGGVTGLSAALSARQAGAEVLLLEREAMLGYGATGRNAGILSAGINMSLVDLDLDSEAAAFWPATTQMLLALVKEAQPPDSLLSARLTGALSLAESSSAAYRLIREVQAREELGLRAELWTRSQVAQYTQGRLNTSSVVMAMWLPDEGRINPLTLLAHLARQARAAGVRLLGQAQVSEVQEISREGSHYWQLVLSQGTTIKTRGLIQSVGPTTRPNARIYALSFAVDLPDDFPLFWDAFPYTYADYRPGNGRLNVSGGRYGKAGMTRHDRTYFQRLIEGTQRWLPELVGQEPLFQWAVDLDVSADMIPHLRPIGEHLPGLAIEGLGALGVLPGIILGQRAGQTIVGT